MFSPSRCTSTALNSKVGSYNCAFSLLIVDQEATLEVGAEGGTAEAAQEAGAAPTAVTKATGELVNPAVPCGLHPVCSSGRAQAEWGSC